MKSNQNVLIVVVIALVIVIGFLVYNNQHHKPETLGEKVGQTIDHATGELDKAVDGKSR